MLTGSDSSNTGFDETNKVYFFNTEVPEGSLVSVLPSGYMFCMFEPVEYNCKCTTKVYNGWTCPILETTKPVSKGEPVIIFSE